MKLKFKYSALLASFAISSCGPSAALYRAYDQVSATAGRKNIAVLEVPSTGQFADATVEGLQSVFGEASLPRRIRSEIKTSIQDGNRFYVMGQTRSKNEWALLTALQNASPNELAGAVVYFDPPISREINTAAKTAGVQVIQP